MRNAINLIKRQVEILSRGFPGRFEELRRVRALVGSFLEGSPLTGDVQQVACELAANAVGHSRSAGPGGHFLVELGRWRGVVAVSVTDQGGDTGPIDRGGRELLADHGRGLVLVAELSAWSGWYGDADGRTFLAVFTDDQAGS